MSNSYHIDNLLNIFSRRSISTRRTRNTRTRSITSIMTMMMMTTITITTTTTTITTAAAMMTMMIITTTRVRVRVRTRRRVTSNTERRSGPPPRPPRLGLPQLPSSPLTPAKPRNGVLLLKTRTGNPQLLLHQPARVLLNPARKLPEQALFAFLDTSWLVPLPLHGSCFKPTQYIPEPI